MSRSDKDGFCELYRGIYTDEKHIDLINRVGFEEKWYIDDRKLLFEKSEIDKVLMKNDIKLEDTQSTKREEAIKVIYACATKRDACYYAVRNIGGGVYFMHSELIREEHPRPEDCSLYLVKFRAPKENVWIDPNDSLYPFSYRADKWSGERLKLLCKLYGKNIVMKYLEKLQAAGNNADACNALVVLMSCEPEAIETLYKNKTILIHGKRNVELYSSFKVNYQVKAEDIISIDKTTEMECRSYIEEFDNSPDVKHLSTMEFFG